MSLTHAYAVDELFIWDTVLTMHAAAVIDEARDADNTRLMHRISVKGYPSLAADARPKRRQCPHEQLAAFSRCIDS